MMAKYHLTDDGPKLCTAQEGNCKYRLSAGEHFTKISEARLVYEDRMKNNLLESMRGIAKVDKQSSQYSDKFMQKVQNLVDNGQDEKTAIKVVVAMYGEDYGRAVKKRPINLKRANTIAQGLLKKAKNIEIPDHSNAQKDYVNLTELSDEVVAGNNCYAATSIISEYLYRQNIENDTIEVIMDDDTVHYANKVGDFVIDFSFRQFDKEAAFPLVQKYDEWLKNVDESVNNKFGLRIKSDSIVS